MDDNKNIIIIVVCACCLLMTMIIACSKGCGKKEEEKKVVVVPQQNYKKAEEKEIIKESKSNYSYSSSRGLSSGKPPALLSEEDKAKLIKNYKEDDQKITELKKEWMKKKLEDPNISKEAYEQYKLRSNPSFLKGMTAFENNDYDAAIVSFNEILKDKESTTVSKFFACSQLMDVAREKHDFDLYFIAARMRANLIENEDLSILGIDKEEEKGTLEWINEVENLLKARNDSKYFDICVENRLAEVSEIDDEDKPSKEEIIQEVNDEIEYYSNIYKDLIE